MPTRLGSCEHAVKVGGAKSAPEELSYRRSSAGYPVCEAKIVNICQLLRSEDDLEARSALLLVFHRLLASGPATKLSEVLRGQASTVLLFVDALAQTERSRLGRNQVGRRIVWDSKATLGTGTMPSDVDLAERWRTLAAEARAAADEMTDPKAKRTLLSIAEGYERLARRAAARKKDQEDSK